MMKRVITLCAVAAMLAACGADGETGPAGAAALVHTSAEPAGENCANGGIAIRTGLDADADGELADAELTDTSYVCNGPAGEPGEDGEQGEGGSPGAPALVETAEATTCGGAGGVVIRAGVDADGDGALSDDEVTDEETLCNAPDTANGAILIQETELPIGPECGGGGLATQVGRDVNENGTLEADEVESQIVECYPCPEGFGEDPNDATQCVAVHTITFEGVFEDVRDDDGLDPGIANGDAFTGTILLTDYTAATDTNPDGQMGIYSFTGVPNSFTVEVNGKTYTSSRAAELNVEIFNDFGFVNSDEYRIMSMANEMTDGLDVTMGISMFDADGMAFGGDNMRLPMSMTDSEQTYFFLELSEGQDNGGGGPGPGPGPVIGGSFVSAFGSITTMNVQ